VGGLARLGTVLLETDDKMYILGFVLSVVLNGIIVVQFLLYWNSPVKGASEKPSAPQSKGKKTKAEKVD
jgi:hypothetical protein